MNGRYVIFWRSSDNGTIGRSKKSFTREAADALCDELNARHPKIAHTVVGENDPNPPLVVDMPPVVEELFPVREAVKSFDEIDPT